MTGVLAGLVAWAGVASTAPACEGIIDGQIVDATTADPIPRATLEFPWGTTETDEEGRFHMEGACPGAWTVTVSRIDYKPRRQKGTTSPGEPVHLDLTLEPTPVDRLEDVVVEAPAPHSRRGAGLNTSLEGEALERVRGQAFADSLARLPGVAVLRSSSGGMGKPIIRGQFGRRTLIIYDGVRHESQQWGIEHAPEIDPLSAGDLTIRQGGGAIRYGSDAVGGVVLVAPPVMPSAPGVGGQIDLIGVSNGRRGTAALRLEGAHARAPGLSWRVDGNLTRGAALMTPDYPLDNTGVWMWNGGARLHYTRSRVAVELSYRHHMMKAGICVCLRIDTPEAFAAAVVRGRPLGVELYSSEYRIERPYQHVVHDIAIARTTIDARTAGVLQWTYAFQNNARDEYEQARAAVQGPQLAFDLQTHLLEGVLEHRAAAIGRRSVLEGQLGVSATHQRNRYDGVDTLIPDYRQWAGAVFATERWRTKRFELEVGARYDGMHRLAALTRSDYRGQVGAGRLDPEQCESRGDGGADCSRTFHTASASIGALGRPVKRAPEFTVKLDVTSTGRIPSVDELYLNGSAPSFPVLGFGNPMLSVERTWGWALTLAHASPWIAVEGSAFTNIIEDYIYFAPMPGAGQGGLQETVRGTFPIFAFRPVNAIFYGGELGFRIKPPRVPLEFDGQSSWVRAQDLADRSGLAFIPPDRYRLGITYRWPDVWRLRDGYIAVHGTAVDRSRHPSPQDFAPPPPAYGLLEAETGVELEMGRQRLRLALSGGNLTHSRYRDYTSLLRYFAQEPGWQVMVRLTLVFQSLNSKNVRRADP